MARKSIVTHIALDGGKTIEKQLKDLGEAGEKAFNQIRAAAARADFAKFGASLKAFGSDLAMMSAAELCEAAYAPPKGRA